MLSRSIANTRPRDFYDFHILYALRGAKCNAKTLLQAVERTADKRGSSKVLEIYPDSIARALPAADSPCLVSIKYQTGAFLCVPSMALILLVQVQPRVFTAKCSEPQVGISNGMDGGSGVAKFLSLRTET